MTKVSVLPATLFRTAEKTVRYRPSPSKSPHEYSSPYIAWISLSISAASARKSMCCWVPCGMESPFSAPSSWLFTRARCHRPIARHPFNIRFKPGQCWAGFASRMKTFGHKEIKKLRRGLDKSHEQDDHEN